MAPKKDIAERKIRTALAKLQAWNKELKKSNVQDWQSVGKALHLAHQAINTSPKYYKSWILLADIYFQIGKINLAQKSLDKAYSLINLRPDFPGSYYERIEKKLKTDETPYNGKDKDHLIPDWFQQKYRNYFYDRERYEA